MKKIISLISVLLIMRSLLCVGASADMGPKPSVNVTFPRADGNFYVTLLSKTASTGPYSADHLDDIINSYSDAAAKSAFRKFAAYEDEDGFFFLGAMSYLDIGDETYRWGYYPPHTFKILIYFPGTDTFAVSPVLERYAFSSYFKATVNGNGVTAEATVLSAEKNYNYTREILLFVSRLALTIAIEIAVAALFGFFKGKYRKAVLTVNIVTQVLLNVTLNLFDYYIGWLSVIFIYVLCELAIFVIEGVIYGIVFPKCASDGETPVRAWKAWLYSLAANAASFLVGACIWWIDIALMG